MAAYYNENDLYPAEWLRNLIKQGLIPDGDVDTRSITEVKPEDLKGYTQCHFFAGIGGWAYAARLANWADDRPLWTGSCPCQPFSVAGKGEGRKDKRHLWPEFYRLIRACRPPVVMGEQVAAAIGKDWLDGVFIDLEGIDYACGAVVVPACAVDAPHRRDRLWFVADYAMRQRCNQQGQIPTPCPSEFEDRGCSRSLPLGDSSTRLPDAEREAPGGTGRRIEGRTAAESGRASGAWAQSDWINGHDGKARRVKPGVRLLAHGIPGRVGQLRAYGNAIVPQVAAEVISAYMDAFPVNT